ncbi:MAG: adenosine kinase [Azospirillaceae bacterium]|nr:adenosine kinase [Azospirillaceae bacterium]
MSQHDFEVTGIGNAIVDVIAHADDQFLIDNQLQKGAMNLIDADRADHLYAKMGSAIQMSGGSAGNTMAGFAQLGGRAAYIGKVRDDALGSAFRQGLAEVGVQFRSRPAADGLSTARSLILVTPDAQRTMNTYLGACVELGPEDIDVDLIKASKIIYLEGYLWDPPKAKEAFLKAAAVAHDAGRQVALSLSDSFCVVRHRDSFRALVRDHVDILFANESEILALFETDSLTAALDAVGGHCDIAVVTSGAEGAIVVSGDERQRVAAEPVTRLVDTTGAGDLFAAGFLFGHSRGRSRADCARIGAIAAAEIIGHYGARPEADLAALVKQRMGN